MERLSSGFFGFLNMSCLGFDFSFILYMVFVCLFEICGLSGGEEIGNGSLLISIQAEHSPACNFCNYQFRQTVT